MPTRRSQRAAILGAPDLDGLPGLQSHIGTAATGRGRGPRPG